MEFPEMTFPVELRGTYGQQTRLSAVGGPQLGTLTAALVAGQ
jgi:hypothetical protein